MLLNRRTDAVEKKRCCSGGGYWRWMVYPSVNFFLKDLQQVFLTNILKVSENGHAMRFVDIIEELDLISKKLSIFVHYNYEWFDRPQQPTHASFYLTKH